MDGRRKDRPKAHPRSRGENGFAMRKADSDDGSSPLTRGKPRVDLRGVEDGGLIPAHAGKTSAVMTSAATLTAHPRSRGENADGAIKNLSIGGSSPLTRGKPFGGVGEAAPVGLIPAHAGKTRRARPGRALQPAHPRSRGENVIASAARVFTVGSSPLTRGKLFLTCTFIA